MSDHPQTKAERPRARRSSVVAACAVVFLVACGVRALYWQDYRHGFMYRGMAEEYKAHTLVLVEGKYDLFLRGPDPPSHADFVKHPPGYPVLQAAVFKLFGVNDAPMRALHVLLDAAAAILVLLIALELFNLSIATMAGLLVALSPQLAFHSITLVPDPLAAPPLLVAFYLLVRTGRRPRLASVAAAGLLVGLSCWLRSNALLLAPFLALLAPLLFERGRRLRAGAVLAGSALACIAPITIRNVVVYRSFIPISLSAGITFVEGIGVYDEEGRFGLPSTDYGVTKWEAEMYGRPDYLGTRFAPDGVERERLRVRHALAVVRAHPVWFLGVMAHRAASMLRLARVEPVASEPAVAHAPVAAADGRPAWAVSPEEWAADRSFVQTELSAAGDTTARRFAGESDGALITSPPVAVEKETDYLLRLPLKLAEGSVVVEVLDARTGARLAATPILHPVNWLDLTPDAQPAITIERPFVSGDSESVRVVVRQGGRRAARVVAEVGRAEAFALGPSAHTWTRLPRLLVRAVQRLFLTATFLPLVLLGVVRLARARCWRDLALLLALPAYYMCTQSALWTEFRYILPMHYPLLLLAAAGLHWIVRAFRRSALKLKR